MSKMQEWALLRAPRTTGKYALTATSTSTGAAELDLGAQAITNGWKSAKQKMIALQAVSQDCYILFKPAITSSTSVTSSNGLYLKAGEKPMYFMNLDCNALEHVAAGTGTLRWWFCSDQLTQNTP